MAVYRSTIIPEYTNRIYEKKGSSADNGEYITAYLENYEGSRLVCDGKVICDTACGTKYIYFREDFPDYNSIIRLYNFILNGNGEDEQSAGKKFVLESELDYYSVLETEAGIKAADHDRHVVIINEGATVYTLVRDARLAASGDTGKLEAPVQPTAPRPGSKQEYEFLYDKNKERFFEKLAHILPFSRELKKELEEKKETFAECLFRLMREKGIQSQSELTAKNGRLGVSKAVMSKWINNRDPNRTPDKATVYAIIMAARLDMKDAEALLKSANLSFGYDMEDIIVKTFIRNSMYDLEKLNDVVFEITHKTLLNKRDG